MDFAANLGLGRKVTGEEMPDGAGPGDFDREPDTDKSSSSDNGIDGTNGNKCPGVKCQQSHL